MSKAVRLIDNVGFWLLGLTLAATPLFFLPITSDFYNTNKWMLLILSSTILVILWLIRTTLTKEITFRKSQAGVALLALSLASLLSTLFIATNKVESVVSLFGLATLLALSVFFFIGQTFINNVKKNFLFWLFISGAGVAALIAIYQILGFGKALFPNSFVASQTWTPVGSLIGLGSLVILALPLALSKLFQSFSHKKEAQIIALIILVLLLGAAFVIALINLLSQFTTTFMPLSAAWAITLEEFKNLGNALLGVGSGNYLNAFTVGRPVGLNAGPLWNIRFIFGPSFLFEITATLGFLGLISAIFLIRSMVVGIKSNSDWGLKLSLILAIILFLVVPPTLTFLVATVVLLILSEGEANKNTTFRAPPKQWLLAADIAIVLLMAVFFYFLGLFYAGELAFYQSAIARSKNDGTKTYNRQIQAIQFDPAISNYHIGLSQTSLALASSIISSAATGTTSAELSDDDRKLAIQLISQAISEAKNATAISPKSVVPWQNLAGIYEAVLKIAQGADQWTVAAYEQAIQLDPSNPILRVQLGGIYLTLNNLDNAVSQFRFATLLKPDYANAFYNLAYVYKAQNKFLQAAIELTAAKSLVQPGSDDEKKLASELTELRSRLTKEDLDFLDNQYTNTLTGTNTSGIVSPVSAPSTNFENLGPIPVSSESGVPQPQSTSGGE